MDLTIVDQNELLKAAVRCTDREIAEWLVRLTELHADGKRNVPCPPYRVVNGQLNGHQEPAAVSDPLP